MPQNTLGDVLRYLRKVCAVQAGRELDDGELLKRFVVERDDAAFTVLVHRHGPMVLGVCQRALGDVHAAEDAFQAAFLVLVRRAASLSRRKPLGGWLYGVAQRVAANALKRAAIRRRLERQAATMPREQPLDDASCVNHLGRRGLP
jgi:DNA-directed RNA polymerase specialized sigma24 family protein